MPCYLGDYQNCASDRVRKFRRALKSFIEQPYPDKELVIVADGCHETMEQYLECKALWSWPEDLVTFLYIGKQKDFGGYVRNHGIANASGQVIAYLDSDDMFFDNHLGYIAGAFKKYGGPDWVYFNDYTAKDGTLQMHERQTLLTYGRIGTSTIAHKQNLNIAWKDGYSHDWDLVLQLTDKFPNNKKIHAPGYLVCHIPTIIDY